MAWQSAPVFLPGESPWTEEPGGLQAVGSQRVRCDPKYSSGGFVCSEEREEFSKSTECKFRL